MLGAGAAGVDGAASDDGAGSGVPAPGALATDVDAVVDDGGTDRTSGRRIASMPIQASVTATTATTTATIGSVGRRRDGGVNSGRSTGPNVGGVAPPGSGDGCVGEAPWSDESASDDDVGADAVDDDASCVASSASVSRVAPMFDASTVDAAAAGSMPDAPIVEAATAGPMPGVPRVASIDDVSRVASVVVVPIVVASMVDDVADDVDDGASPATDSIADRSATDAVVASGPIAATGAASSIDAVGSRSIDVAGRSRSIDVAGPAGGSCPCDAAIASCSIDDAESVDTSSSIDAAAGPRSIDAACVDTSCAIDAGGGGSPVGAVRASSIGAVGAATCADGASDAPRSTDDDVASSIATSTSAARDADASAAVTGSSVTAFDPSDASSTSPIGCVGANMDPRLAGPGEGGVAAAASRVAAIVGAAEDSSAGIRVGRAVAGVANAGADVRAASGRSTAGAATRCASAGGRADRSDTGSTTGGASRAKDGSCRCAAPRAGSREADDVPAPGASRGVTRASRAAGIDAPPTGCQRSPVSPAAAASRGSGRIGDGGGAAAGRAAAASRASVGSANACAHARTVHAAQRASSDAFCCRAWAH